MKNEPNNTHIPYAFILLQINQLSYINPTSCLRRLVYTVVHVWIGLTNQENIYDSNSNLINESERKKKNASCAEDGRHPCRKKTSSFPEIAKRIEFVRMYLWLYTYLLLLPPLKLCIGHLRHHRFRSHDDKLLFAVTVVYPWRCHTVIRLPPTHVCSVSVMRRMTSEEHRDPSPNLATHTRPCTCSCTCARSGYRTGYVVGLKVINGLSEALGFLAIVLGSPMKLICSLLLQFEVLMLFLK